MVRQLFLLQQRTLSDLILDPIQTLMEKFEKCNNHFILDVCLSTSKLTEAGKVIMIIITSLFLKSFIFKMFSIHNKTQRQHFQIPLV